ncbi:hypothetical protein VPHD479_0221 [Vibrio phage D479]
MFQCVAFETHYCNMGSVGRERSLRNTTENYYELT